MRNCINEEANPDCKVNLRIEIVSVGKVNIVYGFMSAILKAKEEGIEIDHVLNIGSVGSIDGNGINVGDVVNCYYAIQADLDFTGILDNKICTNKNDLNLPTDNTAFHEIKSPIKSKLETRFSSVICASSDKFPMAYTDPKIDEIDKWYNLENSDGRKAVVLDQEIGALAPAIRRYNLEHNKKISCTSVKYVAIK